jgi:hypothetical protein
VKIRHLKSRGLRLAGGLALSLAVAATLLAAIEFGLRLEREHQYFGLRMAFFRMEKMAEEDPPVDFSLDEKALARLPDPFAQVRDPKITGHLSGANVSVTEKELGPAAYRVTKKFRDDGPVIYDVTYRSDHGRRITAGPRPATKNRVLMLGCSFTYGEGLDGSQTLASYLQAGLQNAKVETLAFHGYSINNLLYDLRRNLPDGPYGDLSAENGTVAFYFFIPQHLPRIACTLACHGANMSPWMKHMPNFETAEDGAPPALLGTFGETVSFPFLLQELADSAIVTELNLDWPTPGMVASKFSQLVIAYRDELAQKVNLRDFYFVYHPSSSVSPAMKAAEAALVRHGIKVLTPSFDLQELTAGRQAIPFDGHPSNHANFVISRYLQFILKQQHPGFTQARKESP